MKDYIGNCINNPFDDVEILQTIIEEAREITEQDFFMNCEHCNTFRIDVKDYPDDYMFYRYEDIYFYTHSGIEYFYR